MQNLFLFIIICLTTIYLASCSGTTIDFGDNQNGDSDSSDIDKDSTETGKAPIDGDTTIPTDGDSTPQPDGDSTIPVDGDTTPQPDGDSTIPVDGDTAIPTDGDVTTIPDGDSTPEPDGDTSTQTDGDNTTPIDGDATTPIDGDTDTIENDNATPASCEFSHQCRIGQNCTVENTRSTSGCCYDPRYPQTNSCTNPEETKNYCMPCTKGNNSACGEDSYCLEFKDPDDNTILGNYCGIARDCTATHDGGIDQGNEVCPRGYSCAIFQTGSDSQKICYAKCWDNLFKWPDDL